MCHCQFEVIHYFISRHAIVRKTVLDLLTYEREVEHVEVMRKPAFIHSGIVDLMHMGTDQHMAPSQNMDHKSELFHIRVCKRDHCLILYIISNSITQCSTIWYHTIQMVDLGQFGAFYIVDL